MTFPIAKSRTPTWVWIVLAAMAALAIAAGVYVALMLTNGGSQGAPPTAADIAHKAGCGPVTYDSAPLELYIHEGLTCDIGGKHAHVVTFAGTKQRDDYLKVAKGFGGNYVVGEGYIITVESPDAARLIAGQLGASVG